MQNPIEPPTSKPQISHDLIGEILKHLERDKPSLCAVSLSSTLLRHEAQTILFRNVKTLLKDDAHPKFLRTVAASPSRLALLVRAYRIAKINMSQDFSTILHEALQAMCNLKHLDIYYVGPMEWQAPDGPAVPLRGCTFKLESFAWLSDAFQAQELVYTFLPQQDGLKRVSLQFDHFISPMNLRPAATPIILCPKLVSLVASWQVIKVLLPGHEINTLTILDTYNTPSTKFDITRIIPALEHVKVLSYPFLFQCEEIPSQEQVLPHCFSLTVLELGRFDAEKICVILPKLPSLQRLVLSYPLSPKDSWPEEQVTALVQRLFDSSSINLRHVDIRLKKETYQRYIRTEDGDGAASRVIRSRDQVRALFAK